MHGDDRSEVIVEIGLSWHPPGVRRALLLCAVAVAACIAFVALAHGRTSRELDEPIHSVALGGRVHARVILPPGYDQHPHTRYPVIYFLHGLPATSGTYNGNDWLIDARLQTIASASGRVLAGLSAGGYGAVDIALRHPNVFGTVESWSGYFRPLRDGPFKDVPQSVLDANDPVKLVPSEAQVLRADHIRFFLSSGPAHSHWFKPAETIAFAAELRRAGMHPTLRLFPSLRGEWTQQLASGLAWALP